MKKALLLSLLSIIVCLSSNAQRKRIEYRHDLRAGVGLPTPVTLNRPYISENEKESLPRAWASANYYLYYGYRIIKGLKVTGTVSYYTIFEPRFASTPYYPECNIAGGDNSGRYHHLRLSPAVQYEWFNRGIVTMYSDVGCTFDFTSRYDQYQGAVYHDKKFMEIRANFTPFGITIGGKKLFGSAELFSFGPRGLFNIGLGYRF